MRVVFALKFLLLVSMVVTCRSDLGKMLPYYGSLVSARIFVLGVEIAFSIAFEKGLGVCFPNLKRIFLMDFLIICFISYLDDRVL